MAKTQKTKAAKSKATEKRDGKSAKPKAAQAEASKAKSGGPQAGLTAKPAAKPAKAEAKPALSGRDALVANARRALELKQRAPKPQRPESRTPNKGMPPLPNPEASKEGALEAEGGKPALERAHKAR